MLTINQIDYPWVSPRLVQEVLVGCGSKSTTAKNYRLIASLLSHILINPDKFTLTERERTCLFWFAHGKPRQEISLLMHIKEGYVRTLVKRIKHKQHCNTIAEAIFITMRFKNLELNEQSITELLYKVNEGG